MKDDSLFKRIAAITAIISSPIALGASLVLLLAIDFDTEIIENPANMLTLDPPLTNTFRVVELVGLFGYALLVVPVTLYLWHWLKPKSPMLVNLYTLFGLGGLFVGALSSAFLFSLLPPLMGDYVQAASAEREIITVVFNAGFDLAVVGILNLSYILTGIWLLGIGSVMRADRRGLGSAALIIGIGVLVYGVLDVLRVEPAAALEIFTFLVPIWTLWLGIVVLRDTGETAGSTSNI